MQKTVSIKRSLSLTKPKREPLPRIWFMARGYTKADPAHVKGKVVWLHPKKSVRTKNPVKVITVRKVQTKNNEVFGAIKRVW